MRNILKLILILFQAESFDLLSGKAELVQRLSVVNRSLIDMCNCARDDLNTDTNQTKINTKNMFMHETDEQEVKE